MRKRDATISEFVVTKEQFVADTPRGNELEPDVVALQKTFAIEKRRCISAADQARRYGDVPLVDEPRFGEREVDSPASFEDEPLQTTLAQRVDYTRG
jgi:hypothetical protein